jgi:uncharacterized protein
MKKIWIFLIWVCGLSACADDKPTPYLDTDGIPIKTSFYVNDFSQTMLDTMQINHLHRRLKAYEDSTSNQIVVICLPTFPKHKNGDTWDLEDLSLNIARTWGIGQKDKNNGVLLLIILEDKKDRIEVGYGLEGALPDIICKRILDKEIKPNFEEEEYYKGIDQAITAIQRSISGEYQKEAAAEDRSDTFWTIYLISFGVCLLVSVFIHNLVFVLILGGLCGGVGWHMYTHDLLWSLLAAIIGAIALLIASRIARAVILDGGDGDGFSFSSSGISSSSGGGFSGGGGSFGGGGASGGW